MHRLIIALAVAMFCNSSSAADESTEAHAEKWVKQLEKTNTYRFEVLLASESDDNYSVKAIRVIERRTNRPVQTISKIGGMSVRLTPDKALRILDANSDGRPDFYIPMADGGAGPNSAANFYLFDPKKKTFNYSEELSSMIDVSFENDGSVTTSTRSSCCSHSSTTYRWQNGKLKLVATWDESATADGFLVTTFSRLQRGIWEYSEKKVPMPDR